jgi:hypothetical protein
MSIFRTAYDTTACVGYQLSKTSTAINAAYYDGSVDRIPDTNIRSIVGGSALANNVPAFAHPLLVDIDNNKLLFIDARSYGKIDINSNSFKVRNETEYNLLVTRAKLNEVWIKDNPLWLRDISYIPMSIFSSWISESISRRFALDPREQFNLAILAAIFYNSLFTDEAEITEHEKLRLINSISRSIHASTTDVMEIIDKVSVVNNVFEYCSHAEEISGSIRLKELNPGILYSILGNTWFGTNAKEMVAVALEHPPTWIAILISAFTERSFKNSQISKLTERSNYKRDGDNFVRAVSKLLQVTSMSN